MKREAVCVCVTSCPVCRYVQTPVPTGDNKCFECSTQLVSLYSLCGLQLTRYKLCVCICVLYVAVFTRATLLAMALCLSVCHRLEFCRNGRMNPAGFWHRNFL